jgi:guanylate kinase
MSSSAATPPRPGRLFVLSGPSGSGKSTIIARALEPGDMPVRLAISATTRPKRPGEVDGVHYHFWTPEQFTLAVADNQFLEWAQVYGHSYGTLRSEVEPYLAAGKNVLLEIDVQGGEQIRQRCPGCILVFVRASTLAEYEQRLRTRRTEDEVSLARRLRSAEEEMRIGATYHHQLINDNLGQAVADFRQLLQHSGG